MMVIVRHERGAQAPRDARYALVGHFGEPTGFAVCCNAGEALPLESGDDEVVTPLWYVEVGEEASELLAA
jgi:hypothetical protein